jgi:hypothetical protein
MKSTTKLGMSFIVAVFLIGSFLIFYPSLVKAPNAPNSKLSGTQLSSNRVGTKSQVTHEIVSCGKVVFRQNLHCNYLLSTQIHEG